MTQKYDVIIYGATGFTGSYIVENFLKNNENANIAIAGRNEFRLLEVRNKFAQSKDGKSGKILPFIVADCFDDEALDRMLSHTKVVINAIGPYRLYGEQVVKAAIRNSVHYVDICGEPYFLEKMQMIYDEDAKAKGVYIVGACGWDSIICDLGIVKMKQIFNGSLDFIETFTQINFGSEGYSINGGTYRSLILGLSNARTDELGKIRRAIMPEKLPKNEFPPPKRGRMFYNDYINSWCIPFLGSDKSVVMRTQYSDYFCNKQRPVTINTYYGIQSLLNALLLLLWFFLLDIFLRCDKLKTLIYRNPKFCSFNMFSDDGPTVKQIKETTFSYWFFGECRHDDTVDGGENRRHKKVILRCNGPDPGYQATSACVIAASTVIIKDFDLLPKGGGVLSPGYAFKNTSIFKLLKDFSISYDVIEETFQ